MIARGPPPAGGRGFRKQPSGAFTVMGRSAPSFMGPKGSVRHFTAAYEYERV
jgi:hypothetical protein